MCDQKKKKANKNPMHHVPEAMTMALCMKTKRILQTVRKNLLIILCQCYSKIFSAMQQGLLHQAKEDALVVLLLSKQEGWR